MLLCVAIGAQRRGPEVLAWAHAFRLGVYAWHPFPDGLSQTQNWASEVHLLCSFLFFHLPQHQGQKRQSEAHGVVREWAGPWHWGVPTRHWGLLTRHFISIFSPEPFLWVNEDVSLQPQPHYVKELLTACSISLTFMVILKPKWWTITLHSLQIKAGC